MSEPYVLSISELNSYTASLFTNDALLRNLSIRGEISGFKRHSSGHIYFSMKDDEALVRCVMFRQNALSLDFQPSDGMEVTATGYVSLYVKDGQYQFYVKGLAARSEGALYRRFMMMKNRLEAEGLFDEAHKRPLPKLPKTIGLITSGTGAAVQDMINIIRRRYPMMDIALCPVTVQGADAAREIAEGIRLMNQKKAADVLIVGRGGGSMEDLFAFNEEIVARAIYESEIPVVSAVGHETDFTIADFAADLRAPTPSAAAELCVPEYEALILAVERQKGALHDAIYSTLDGWRDRLTALSFSAGMAAPGHNTALARQELMGKCAELRASARAALDAGRNRFSKVCSALFELAPELVLKRGYAMISADGEYITSAKSLMEHSTARVIMHDGAVEAAVKGEA